MMHLRDVMAGVMIAFVLVGSTLVLKENYDVPWLFPALKSTKQCQSEAVMHGAAFYDCERTSGDCVFTWNDGVAGE